MVNPFIEAYHGKEARGLDSKTANKRKRKWAKSFAEGVEGRGGTSSVGRLDNFDYAVPFSLGDSQGTLVVKKEAGLQGYDVICQVFIRGEDGKGDQVDISNLTLMGGEGRGARPAVPPEILHMPVREYLGKMIELLTDEEAYEGNPWKQIPEEFVPIAGRLYYWMTFPIKAVKSLHPYPEKGEAALLKRLEKLLLIDCTHFLILPGGNIGFGPLNEAGVVQEVTVESLIQAQTESEELGADVPFDPIFGWITIPYSAIAGQGDMKEQEEMAVLQDLVINGMKRARLSKKNTRAYRNEAKACESLPELIALTKGYVNLE